MRKQPEGRDNSSGSRHNSSRFRGSRYDSSIRREDGDQARRSRREQWAVAAGHWEACWGEYWSGTCKVRGLSASEPCIKRRRDRLKLFPAYRIFWGWLQEQRIWSFHHRWDHHRSVRTLFQQDQRRFRDQGRRYHRDPERCYKRRPCVKALRVRRSHQGWSGGWLHTDEEGHHRESVKPWH